MHVTLRFRLVWQSQSGRIKGPSIAQGKALRGGMYGDACAWSCARVSACVYQHVGAWAPVCVCMRVPARGCVSACVCIYLCVCKCVHVLCAPVCVCVYLHVGVCVFMHVHVLMCVHVCFCMCVCLCVCACLCVQASVSVCVPVCACGGH